VGVNSRIGTYAVPPLHPNPFLTRSCTQPAGWGGGWVAGQRSVVCREGFHRTLHISLVPRQSWLKRSGHYEVVVMQLLSSSLFADEFQLEDLTRMGGAPLPFASVVGVHEHAAEGIHVSLCALCSGVCWVQGRPLGS